MRSRVGKEFNVSDCDAYGARARCVDGKSGLRRSQCEQIKQPRSQDLVGAAAAAAKELVVMVRVVGDFCRIGLG